MRLPHPRFRSIAAVSAVACFGVGAGTVGAHAATVEVAILQAGEAARTVEDKRASLSESLDRAREVTGEAESHLSEVAVSSAVDELGTTLTAAATTASDHKILIDVPVIEALPPRVSTATTVDIGGPATDASVFAADDAQDAEAEETTEDIEASDVAVDDPVVQGVLEGEVRDLESVRKVAEELESAAAALDEAAADVDRVVDEVTDAAEQAALKESVVGLDSDIEDTDVRLAATFAALASVGDRVSDRSVIEAAADARDALKAASASTADRDDIDSVGELTDKISAAKSELDTAMDAVRASHLVWVDGENARIDTENAARAAAYDEEVAAALASRTDRYRAAVAAHQNGWTGAPSGVTYANGRVPASQLCGISFASGHMLQCDAADALELANDAFRAQTGRNLSFTDSYRSYSSQVATRAAKPSTAAVPGTSNHGWGMAVDFDYESARWMATHGADFGWVHPTWARSGGSKPEWWHLEFVAPGVGSETMPATPVLQERVVSAFPDA